MRGVVRGESFGIEVSRSVGFLLKKAAVSVSLGSQSLMRRRRAVGVLRGSTPVFGFGFGATTPSGVAAQGH